MRKNIYPAAILSLLSLSGCATIFYGANQNILVKSNVDGATIKVDTRTVGKTPMSVPMARKSEHVVRVEKEGYKPFEYSIRSTPTSAYWLNMGPVLAGSIISLVAISKSDINNPDEDESGQYLPIIAGCVGGLGGSLVDASTGASRKLLEDRINANLVKIPEKVALENSIALACTTVAFKIPPGTKIGTVRVDGHHKSDIKWENTVNVKSDELMGLVNKNLNDFGYNIPVETENRNKLSRAKTAKVYLVGTIEEIKYDVRSKTYESDRRAAGYNTVMITMSHDYKTDCQLKVNWALYNARNKELIYQETTVGKGVNKEDTGTTVVFEAFENSLYALLNNGNIQEHLLKKEGQPDVQQQEPIVLNKPAEAKEGVKVNEYMPEILKGVITVQTPYVHGSGFIVSEDGYAVTNFHVVEGFEKVKISFENGDSLEARVIGFNEDKDLALLKLPGNSFKPLRISTANEINLGSEVYAIGTPTDISLGQTISRGIISGRRNIENKAYIQTDVSINPGNSGGPLIDTKGNVIGVVNAKLMGQGVEGIGFAIPASEIFSAFNLSYAPAATPVAPPVAPTTTPAATTKSAPAGRTTKNVSSTK